MLKIKDNIDLKELEKFGFAWNEKYKEYQFFSYNKDERLCVEDDRRLLFEDFSGFCIIEGLDVLFDLIKADLVEKVEE